MAKLKCKGMVLSQGSGTTFTPVAQIISMGVSGIETETYESRTLDGTAGIEYDPTGYVEGVSTEFELFHDWALAGHQDIHDLVTSACLTTAGAANKVNWKMLAANTSSTEMTFVSAGVGIGITAAMNDGLKASVTLKHSGCPVLPS